MKQLMLGLLAGLSLCFPAHAEVQVFACEPEWAALAREIGGEEVVVFTATSARQDPHHIRAKPSLISAMRRADMLLCTGAGLEIGWLPVLLQKAGTASTQPGATGHVMAADHITLLEVPQTVDRSMGDVHPEGNPHLHLNPHNILRVAEILHARLVVLDYANAGYYRQRWEDFRTRWQETMTRWEEEARELHGMPVVVHHPSWVYLLNWLGLQQIAALEPKPGIPPSAGHLQHVLQTVRTTPAQVILRTPYEAEDASLWLSEKSVIPAIVLPYTVGGNPQAKDLFSLFEETLRLLKEAHHAR